jgi:hypothetical protein
LARVPTKKEIHPQKQTIKKVKMEERQLKKEEWA